MIKQIDTKAERKALDLSVFYLQILLCDLGSIPF